jgi:hypothetical protein
MDEPYPNQFVDLFVQPISPFVRDSLPASVVVGNGVIPVTDVDGVLVVAVTDIWDFELHDKLRFLSNRQIQFVAATKAGIAYAIQRYYSDASDEMP